MAYFEDFTHYSYFPKAPENYLNVGWLSSKHSFQTGTVSEEFLSNLEQLCKKPVNVCRGHHACEFCHIPREIILSGQEHAYRYERNLLGNGEIHVKGADDEIYVAPVLIYHYVQKHHYQPPAAFVVAVECIT